MYKILAYITAYCDRNSLITCLQGIKDQTYPVDEIFILDNSPKPIDFSSLLFEFPVTVNSRPENLGIAFGIHQALDISIRKRYDFLWMFDQDSVPNSNCLEILIRVFEEHVEKGELNIGIISPTPIDHRTGKIIQPAIFKYDRFEGFWVNDCTFPYQCDAPITSGSLLSVKTSNDVPPPDVRLFIDGIDLDYGLRLKRSGYQNIVVPDAVMVHTFGTPVQINFLGIRKEIQRYSALRYYYICRNHTYLEILFSGGFYKYTCVLRRFKFLISQVFWIPIVEMDCKWQKIWACLQGTYYGLTSNLDQQFYKK